MLSSGAGGIALVRTDRVPASDAGADVPSPTPTPDFPALDAGVDGDLIVAGADLTLIRFPLNAGGGSEVLAAGPELGGEIAAVRTAAHLLVVWTDEGLAFYSRRLPSGEFGRLTPLELRNPDAQICCDVFPDPTKEIVWTTGIEPGQHALAEPRFAAQAYTLDGEPSGSSMRLGIGQQLAGLTEDHLIVSGPDLGLVALARVGRQKVNLGPATLIATARRTLALRLEPCADACRVVVGTIESFQEFSIPQTQPAQAWQGAFSPNERLLAVRVLDSVGPDPVHLFELSDPLVEVLTTKVAVAELAWLGSGLLALVERDGSVLIATRDPHGAFVLYRAPGISVPAGSRLVTGRARR